jgi:hypothetical protein
MKIIGPWTLAYGVGGSGLRLCSEIRTLTNYEHAMAFQTASVSTDFPDGWTVSGNTRSTNNTFVEDFPAAAWSGKLWVRPGLAVSSQANGVGDAQVGLQAWITSPSTIAGARTVSVNPDLNAGGVAYYPVTAPLPALSLSEVMVAAVLSGVNGTLTYQPAIRYFNRIDEAPGAWTDLGAPQSPNTNERRNFGGIAVAPGTVAFAQVGIKVTTAARATISLLVAGKY